MGCDAGVPRLAEGGLLPRALVQQSMRQARGWIDKGFVVCWLQLSSSCFVIFSINREAY